MYYVKARNGKMLCFLKVKSNSLENIKISISRFWKILVLVRIWKIYQKPSSFSTLWWILLQQIGSINLEGNCFQWKRGGQTYSDSASKFHPLNNIRVQKQQKTAEDINVQTNRCVEYIRVWCISKHLSHCIWTIFDFFEKL